jgi:hypothetical protein
MDVCDRLNSATDSLKAIALTAADLLSALETRDGEAWEAHKVELRALLADAGLLETAEG